MRHRDETWLEVRAAICASGDSGIGFGGYYARMPSCGAFNDRIYCLCVCAAWHTVERFLSKIKFLPCYLLFDREGGCWDYLGTGAALAT